MEIKKIDRQGHSLSLSKDELWDIYKSMKTQRILEDRLLKMYKGGQLSGAVYPGIGQEASMAGIAAGMEDQDVFGGTHRDLGVQIKRGVTLKEIALNFYGKKDGPSKGRDGNSHFGVVDKGTLMVVSPLPDNLTATQSALAAKSFLKNRRRGAVRAVIHRSRSPSKSQSTAVTARESSGKSNPEAEEMSAKPVPRQFRNAQLRSLPLKERSSWRSLLRAFHPCR